MMTKQLILLGGRSNNNFTNNIIRSCIDQGITCRHLSFEEVINTEYCFEISRNSDQKKTGNNSHPLKFSMEKTLWLLDNPQWITIKDENKYFQDEKKAILIGLLSTHELNQINKFDISKLIWSADMFSVLVKCSQQISGFKIPDFRIANNEPNASWQKRPGYINFLNLELAEDKLPYLYYHLHNPGDLHLAIQYGNTATLLNMQSGCIANADEYLVQIMLDTSELLDCKYIEFLMVSCNETWYVVELSILPHFINKMASLSSKPKDLYNNLIQTLLLVR